MGKKRRYRKKIFKPRAPTDLILRAEIAAQRVEELRINSTKSEDRVKILLDELEMEYIFQYAIFDSWFFIISDFFLPKYRLMIEVDGESHNNKEAKRRERKRKVWLAKDGIKVLRIKNEATKTMTAKALNKKILKYNTSIKK